MLTNYRRHLKKCEHRSEGRAYRRCRCPIWTDGFIGGTEMRCSLDTRDWERAQETVREWEAAGRAPLRQEKEEPVTIARAGEQFLADAEARNLGQSTLKNWRVFLRQLDAFAAAYHLTTPADFDLPSLLQLRASWKCAPTTALSRLEKLRTLFRFAHDNGWVTENLARRLKAPRVDQAPTMPFTADEVSKLLTIATAAIDKANGYTVNNCRRTRALILLLRYSGLRIGDAVTCSTERLVDGKLRLYTQKTGTHVHCPLPEFVVKELDATPRMGARWWFWTGASKTKTCVGDYQSRFADLFEAAGIEGGHAHRFRDTFAVELLLAGVPLEAVSIQLGHSSIRITEKHYSPWVRERQEQAEAQVRRAWARDPIVLLESIPAPSGETKGTLEVHGKGRSVM
jgi:site-specific recombinase XerD